MNNVGLLVRSGRAATCMRSCRDGILQREYCFLKVNRRRPVVDKNMATNPTRDGHLATKRH